MASEVESVSRQAELLRRDGNHCFKKGRFGAAIDFFTEAITLCPHMAVYWTERAETFARKNEWKKVEEDCRKALELHSCSFMAHHLLGLALCKRHEYTEGLKEMEKAWEFGMDQNPTNEKLQEIWQELAKAKYNEWEDKSVVRTSKYQFLKEQCESALIDKHLKRMSQMGNDEIADSYLEQLECLTEVFDKALELDTPNEVPDYFCCKISFEIFRDPVITPSGLTYERAMILDHLEKVGNFDPSSREPLTPEQLVPNLAIKEAVQAFLEKHGWAYKAN